MRQLKLLIKILLLILFFSSFSIAQKTKIIKPDNAKSKVILEIGGKHIIYHSLQSDIPTILSVKGPGKIKILTRAEFNLYHNKKLNYQISYKIDGNGENKIQFSDVVKSKDAEYKNNKNIVPGARKDFEIEVGLGEHTIELWLNTKAVDVAARYVFKYIKPKKMKWSTLCPVTPNEPVDLVTNENVVHYFRFSNEKPLKVKVIGPTTLRILNRIENHYHMKGRISYRLQVKQDGAIKNTYMLSSVRSDVTSYKNNEKMIPGKACEIVINVPGGVHNYEIIPLDKNKSTVLGRIMLPKKDLKLEE